MSAQLIKVSILVLLISFISSAATAQDDYLDAMDIEQESSSTGAMLDKLFKKDDKSATSSSDTTIHTEVEIKVQEQDMADVSENIAVLRVIDKTLGKLYLVDLGLGDKKTINELTIKANACLRPSQKLITPEGRALIEVFETRNRVIERIFNGWIYAQSPAASQLSHPKYDITLAGCKTEQAPHIEATKPAVEKTQ